MQLNEFQARCMLTARWPSHRAVEYPLIGLANEAGEALGEWKKVIRDDNEILTPERRAKIIVETMDTVYYAAATLHDLGVSFNDAAALLFQKLGERNGIDYDKVKLPPHISSSL